MSGAEKWAAIDDLDIETRIGWLKRRCDWFTLANVFDADAPSEEAWEVVGIDQDEDGIEQMFAGRGYTASEAVADAMREVLEDRP